VTETEHEIKNLRRRRDAQRLFFLNTAIWLVLGYAYLLRLSRAGTAPQSTMLVIAVLMFGNSVAMLLVGWGLGRRNHWLYYFALAVLAINILLTFTDQFGILDLITLLVDIGIVVLLVLNIRHYHQGGPAPR
jgi:uncharacterized membrane protein (DUF2068 family)